MEKLQKEKALGTAKHRKQVDNKLKNICRFKIRKFFLTRCRHQTTANQMSNMNSNLLLDEDIDVLHQGDVC